MNYVYYWLFQPTVRQTLAPLSSYTNCFYLKLKVHLENIVMDMLGGPG